MDSRCLFDGHSFGVHTQTIRYKNFSAGRIAKRLFLQEMIKMILCEEVVKVAIFYEEKSKMTMFPAPTTMEFYLEMIKMNSSFDPET